MTDARRHARVGYASDIDDALEYQPSPEDVPMRQRDDVDPETGEILDWNGSSALTIPSANDLQRYTTDEALIALSEQVLEFGKQELSQMNGIEDLQERRAQLMAYEKYMNQTMRTRVARVQARNNLTDAILRYQRKMGLWLKAMPRQQRGGDRKSKSQGAILILPTLDDLNITPTESSRWQKQASIPDEVFDEIIGIVKSNLWELSSYDLEKWLSEQTTDALHSSYTPEWYTPAKYIESARRVLGEIDLDPASCVAANRTVKAATFFTQADDGFAQDWHGRVWLNPPYGHNAEHESNQGVWAQRLIDEYTTDHVDAAILLVSANTSEQWFQPLWDYAICFTDHRINFDAQEGQKKSGANHGSVLVYFGGDVDAFAREFRQHGRVVIPQEQFGLVLP